MSRVRPLLLVVAAILAGCKDLEPIPAEDLGIEVHAPLEPVTPARAFELTLVRRWHKRLGDLTHDGTWDRAFAPLVVKLARSERREDEARVEETRVYRAYAMSRTDVVVPSVAWKPKSAPELQAATPRLTVRVRPEVDADDPGPPEVPAATLTADRDRPASRVPLLVGAFALLALVALAFGRARRRRPAAAPAPPPPPALADTSHEDLPRLAAQPPVEQALGAADLVRRALTRALSFPAERRTREETLAAAGSQAALVPPLARLLALADAVAYGRHAPTPGEGAEALEDARRCLDALATPARPA
jgi:hypothetical protein